jgi:hypothetical protein
MAISYKEARSEIMRAMQVVKELIKRATAIAARERYLELFDALHRELAAIDSGQMAHSNDEYRAITLRFAASKTALEQAHQKALDTSASLGSAAQFITSLSTLAGAL